jgi:hypothetical protein
MAWQSNPDTFKMNSLHYVIGSLLPASNQEDVCIWCPGTPGGSSWAMKAPESQVSYWSQQCAHSQMQHSEHLNLRHYRGLEHQPWPHIVLGDTEVQNRPEFFPRSQGIGVLLWANTKPQCFNFSVKFRSPFFSLFFSFWSFISESEKTKCVWTCSYHRTFHPLHFLPNPILKNATMLGPIFNFENLVVSPAAIPSHKWRLAVKQSGSATCQTPESVSDRQICFSSSPLTQVW